MFTGTIYLNAAVEAHKENYIYKPNTKIEPFKLTFCQWLLYLKQNSFGKLLKQQYIDDQKEYEKFCFDNELKFYDELLIPQAKPFKLIL